MADWKLYTPEGTQDVLPEQCTNKMKMEATISEIFEGFGYQVVETPVMQFYDAFNTPNGKISQEMMFKFFDAEGRILVMRPDITTCLARMVASKMDDGVYPKRLYYCGKVFRYTDQFSSGQKEFCQAGIELFGVKSDLADSEIILCAIESLLAVGLTRFQIDLGQVDFFKALVEQAKLSDSDAEALAELLDKKDALAINEFLLTRSVSSEIREVFELLPTLFGGLEVLDALKGYALNNRAKTALENLKNVYQMIADYGYEDYVSIDLSLVQGINRYTGIIFKGITHGIGYSICSGGRYDGLTGEFGKSLPAVGMAIGTDRLLTVLSRHGKFAKGVGSDFLVLGKDIKQNYAVLTALRENGYVAEQAITDDESEALAYAKKAKIQGILTLTDADHGKIYNLALDETTPVHISELFEEDDHSSCSCGCHGGKE